jgi:hypothetical protein
MMASPFLPTLSELRQLDNVKTRQCAWNTAPKKGQPLEQCKRKISDNGKTQDALRCLQTTNDTRSILEKLAGLQLCGRDHRKDKNRQIVADKWANEMERDDIQPVVQAVSTQQSYLSTPPPTPTTPTRRRRSSFDQIALPRTTESPNCTVTSVSDRHPNSASTAATSTTLSRLSARSPSNNSPTPSRTNPSRTAELSLHGRDVTGTASSQTPAVVPTRPVSQQARQTRSSGLQTTHVETLTNTGPSFSPYWEGTKDVRTLIFDMMAKPLTNTDQKYGNVYGFRRENNGYIKVGTSKDVPQRMRAIRSKCHYKPEVLTQFAVAFACRVERLIHHHLHDVRFREVCINPEHVLGQIALSDGFCNAGKGCQDRHQEWFKIELERLQSVMNLWKRFAESEPYDENHCLKPWWRERIRRLKVTPQLPHQDIVSQWLESVLEEYNSRHQASTSDQSAFEQSIRNVQQELRELEREVSRRTRLEATSQVDSTLRLNVVASLSTVAVLV